MASGWERPEPGDGPVAGGSAAPRAASPDPWAPSADRTDGPPFPSVPEVPSFHAPPLPVGMVPVGPPGAPSPAPWPVASYPTGPAVPGPYAADPFDYAPRSAWTVASLVCIVLAVVGVVVGIVGTIQALARDTPEGEFEEGWVEFAWVFATILWAIALVGLGAVCAVVGALRSRGKGPMRPMVVVTLLLTVPPTSLLLLLALLGALGV